MEKLFSYTIRIKLYIIIASFFALTTNIFSEIYFFNESFENENLMQWYNPQQIEYQLGIYIVSEVSYSGNFSFKAVNPLPEDFSQVNYLSKKIEKDYLKFSCYILFPSGYTLDQKENEFLTIFRWINTNNELQPKWCIGLRKSHNNKFELVCFETNNKIIYSKEINLNIGKWIKFEIIFKIDENQGFINLKVDDEEIFYINNINTGKFLENSFFWRIGNYGEIGRGTHFYIDEINITEPIENKIVDNQYLEIFTSTTSYLVASFKVFDQDRNIISIVMSTITIPKQTKFVNIDIVPKLGLQFKKINEPINNLKQSFYVSGTIKDIKGNFLVNCKVEISGNTLKETITDNYGSYEFYNLEIGSYSVKPFKEGYFFIPNYYEYDSLDTNMHYQDFIAIEELKIGSIKLFGTKDRFIYPDNKDKIYIVFKPKKNGKIKITIKNQRGYLVYTKIIEAFSNTQSYSQWEATNYNGKIVNSGIYFLIVKGAGFNLKEKIIVIR